MTKAWKRWTESDEQFIRDNSLLTYAEIAVHLGRTREAVSVHAGKMKLQRRRKWTPEEDVKLHALAENTPVRQIAKQLKRTAGAVSNRGVVLGVRFTSYTEDHGGDKAYFNLWMVKDHIKRLHELAPEHACGNVSRMAREIFALGLETFDK